MRWLFGMVSWTSLVLLAPACSDDGVPADSNTSADTGASASAGASTTSGPDSDTSPSESATAGESDTDGPPTSTDTDSASTGPGTGSGTGTGTGTGTETDTDTDTDTDGDTDTDTDTDTDGGSSGSTGGSSTGGGDVELGSECVSDNQCMTGVCWDFNDYDSFCFGAVCSVSCKTSEDCVAAFTTAGAPNPNPVSCGGDGRCNPLGSGFGSFVCASSK